MTSDDSKERNRPGLFTRNSTGLVRSISALDVLTFTLLAAGPMVLVPLGVTTLPSIYEGASLPLILGLSIILLLALAYNTAALSSALPRAGGDYVFGSRIVHPIWGMIPSFMVLLSFVVGIGTLTVVSLQAFLGPTILTSYPQYANSVGNAIYGSQINLFALSALILILIFGLAMLSTKGWFWFIRTVSIFALIMLMVLLAYLASTVASDSLISNFNSQGLTGLNQNGIFANATALNWARGAASSPLTTAGAMIFVFFFLAAPISAYFASEIKNTSRSMAIGVIGGTSISWIIATIGILAFAAAFGYDFISAFGFLGLGNPATFNFNVLILAAVKDPNIGFLIGLGFFLATLGLVAAPMLPASRILFAWSFDRLIPSRFSSVSDRTRTPIFSLAIVAILTIIVAGLDSYYTAALGGFLATTIIVAIAFLPNGITAAVLPFRKKEVFDTAPSLVRRKIGGVPLITITGLIHAIGFAVLIILVFLNPVAAGTNNGIIGAGALGLILVGLVVAIIFYPVARAARKSSGLDLEMIYKEIPPE